MSQGGHYAYSEEASPEGNKDRGKESPGKENSRKGEKESPGKEEIT